tara:strand:- start:838 stop:2031 length:1194 start_codon:yes stop_codon:yes gene_type:complete
MSEEKEVKQEGDFKIKKKSSMKKLGKQPEVIKVDLSAKKTEESEVTKVVIPSSEEKKDANTEQETTNLVADKQAETVQEVEAEVSPGEGSIQDDGFSAIQEITEEDISETTEEVVSAIKQSEETGNPLPENIEKLVSFMEETGGNIEDYVRLNADYSNVDSDTLLREYYTKSKPHLDAEEISFLIEDNFSYDEDIDDEREIRKKKLAFKEEVAEAEGFLDDLKGKYYDEIKLRPGVTQEQKKATDFFNRYNEEQSLAGQKRERFKKATSNLLNDDFKGFDFNIGEKKFRYGINNPTKVAADQSNLTDFVGKFLDNGEVKDHKGYHKAMYAASNVDKIATHFYEQGKADAVKDVVNSSKNISDKPRQTSDDSVFINGLKVKAITGVDSSKLRIKKKQF